ncbi:MAG: HupE/UreJ family protein [Parasphingorhabdus sp.]|nr:HupE/UreJ family protein [Parasphingorhabdus sp.]
MGAMLYALLLFCAASSANAHLTPNSEVLLDFGDNKVIADIIIPQGEYAVATGNPVTRTNKSRGIAQDYLQKHIALIAPDGRRWGIKFSHVEFVTIAGPPDLHAIMTATPPSGASPRKFSVQWRAIIDTVPNHSVLFVARQDFGSGKRAEHREVIGALQGARNNLAIDRGVSQPFAGFVSALRLGMEHIAEGHDHLLFIIALLLPAPLIASAGHWGTQPKTARKTLWLVVRIATAFTVGHSITLFGAAFFNWRLLAQPVEAFIALSILISAVHALRPLFPRREPLVAGLFGLVHGLAFATVIGSYGLDVTEKLLTILGFNIGIEIVQLIVIVAIVPSLLIFASFRFYRRVRTVAALLIAGAAIAWGVERVSGTASRVTPVLDSVLSFGDYAIAMLAILAIILAGRRRLVLRAG